VKNESADRGCPHRRSSLEGPCFQSKRLLLHWRATRQSQFPITFADSSRLRQPGATPVADLSATDAGRTPRAFRRHSRRSGFRPDRICNSRPQWKIAGHATGPGVSGIFLRQPHRRVASRRMTMVNPVPGADRTEPDPPVAEHLDLVH
jgi:hypothetical protein